MSVFPGRISQKLDVQGSLVVDQAKVLGDENIAKGVQQSTGTGDSFAKVGSVITFTDADAAFAAADIGRFITVTSPANAGTFLIESCPGATQVTWTNAAGANEGPGAYAWTINDPYSLEDDLNFERTDRKLIKGTANYYSDVPTYARPSAIGETRPKNLTNLLSVDGYATVRDVRQAGVKVRPDINAADGSVANLSNILTTTLFHFNADDLNSFVTIVCAGDATADGTYRISAVTDGQTLVLNGLNPTGAGGACTWALLSERKGVLSARGYADAVDRTGIPLADTGAEDETVYDATFVEVIDPLHRAGITKNDETVIWARSYGNQLDPKRTATNEGTRFFVQFKTGVNTGAAVTASLESLAGRSGAAAALDGGDKIIKGLTGMLAEDVGRYITLYGCGVDSNAGHFKIVTVTSANQVTVDRTGNFLADSGIDWKVSKHPGTFDFYNGDRYVNSQLAETWARTTMVGGLESDAQLAQEIADLREFSGADLQQTAPNLGPNTGNYFVWSELPDPANSNVEEALNELNEQIGNRDFSGWLSPAYDGADLTSILQALADAISSTSVVRTIERLAAAVPKQTLHNMPVGLAYTVDGTNNGLNMWVFWRKQLRDPGSVANGDDYQETTGSGGPGGVGQITPYERIENGDHINYFILK